MTERTKKYWPEGQKICFDEEMNWPMRFAARAEQMRASSVRELLKVTARPEVISFAGGLPAAELFPLEEVREGADTVLQRDGRRALQYGETEGLGELRDWLASQTSTG